MTSNRHCQEKGRKISYTLFEKGEDWRILLTENQQERIMQKELDGTSQKSHHFAMKRSQTRRALFILFFGTMDAVTVRSE